MRNTQQIAVPAPLEPLNRKSKSQVEFDAFCHKLGVSQRPLTLIVLQKYRDTNGSRIVIQLVVYILHSAKRKAYFCKSIAIEMGGVSRYFSKVSGSGVDLTLLNKGWSGETTTFGRDTWTKGGNQQTRIYPYPMVWPLPRQWSETMVPIPFPAL